MFLETLINVTRPCRSSPDMFHRKSITFFLFQQFVLGTNDLLQFRFSFPLFFSTSHFLMPIFQAKFPFIQKSSRTLVRYTKQMKQEKDNLLLYSTYGVCPDIWLDSRRKLLKNNFYMTSWTLRCLDCVVFRRSATSTTFSEWLCTFHQLGETY